MLASFSIVPIGIGDELKTYIADIINIIDRSGLDYKLGAMQTTVEGEQDAVMSLILQCHNFMKAHSPRILTHITIDDREGADKRLEGKVKDVIQILDKDISHE